jgi:tetratricopeptide (TPR) repeat protein
MPALSLALLLVLAQAPAAAATPASLPPPPAAPSGGPAVAPAPTTGAVSADAALPRAAVEKLGAGDRAFLDRDYRSALFAYMDAAYLAPASAAPRAKLARVYLALRYPERAIDQAEKALAVDPANGEARKVLDEARSGGAQAAAPRAAPSGSPAAAPRGGAPPAPRVFPYAPEPAAAEAAPARPAPAVAPAPAPAAPAPAPVPAPARSAGAASSPGPAAQPQPASAAQQYRQGIEHLRNREFDKAVAALTQAVTLDPGLAVAYSARASARFALGAYRDAAGDYRAALDRDAKLATPLYGLAECHRVLGEPKDAAAMYQRYAESRAPDVREDLRAVAAKRAVELR